MSAIAERLANGEATDVERKLVAHMLLHPDDAPKHSRKNMIDADLDREIAEFVNFIASHEGDKKTNVVEQWATKEFGLGRSAIWERVARGRFLLPRKEKDVTVVDLGIRLQPDGHGGFRRVR